MPSCQYPIHGLEKDGKLGGSLLGNMCTWKEILAIGGKLICAWKNGRNCGQFDFLLGK